MRKTKQIEKVSSSVKKQPVHLPGGKFAANKNAAFRVIASESEETHGWDFDELAVRCPHLEEFVFMNSAGRTTINWSDPLAHIALNKAILAVDFSIVFWDMPPTQLIPAIPSRLSYLKWVKERLAEVSPTSGSSRVKGVDIGTGSSVIYPILGAMKFGWTFIATETCEKSLENAAKIINANAAVKERVELRRQANEQKIFEGVLFPSDGHIDFTMCNPPFFQRAEDKTLWKNATMSSNEYIFSEGGELGFLKLMFEESVKLKHQIRLFTSLAGRQTDFLQFKEYLKQRSGGRIDLAARQKDGDGEDGKQKQVEKIQVMEGEIRAGYTTRWIIAWKFELPPPPPQIKEKHQQPQGEV